MKIYLHGFNTWFIANLLHPCLWVVLSLSGLIEGLSSSSDLMQGWSQVFVVSIFFSFPSLFLGIACLKLVLVTPLTSIARYAMWMVIAPLLIFFQFLLLYALFNWMKMDSFVILLPAVGATALTIAIRYRQFRRLASMRADNQEDDEPIKSQESETILS